TIQYKLLLKGQNKNVQSGFRNAQRDWIKYRDSEISAMQVFYRQETGTVWGIVMLESKMNIIRDKAIDLYRLRNSKNLAGESE
ncbi:lysozyme inhibitor LprI family protein, partial [Edwardsiella tarda]|uniref:lysozyme inhibitor LprI family protein n=1 Tax=Edwardsiella tarda TaxID=636 RepID=UPI0012672BB2